MNLEMEETGGRHLMIVGHSEATARGSITVAPLSAAGKWTVPAAGQGP